MKNLPLRELFPAVGEFLLRPGEEGCVAEREQDLLRRAGQGDEGAFKVLAERHREGILNLAYQMVGDPEEAEDIAQEVLLRMLRHWRKFRGDNLRPWLFRMTVNLCMTALKRRKRREAPLDEVEGLEAKGADPTAMIAVREALSRLSPKLRAVLVLRELHGLDYAEIAQVLKVPVGTVRSRLSRAREEFRRIWLEMEEGRG
ncbi:MAG TPA: RNA polymerase sigma factor [Armatimonadetes bacterium]|nr:RNA polymerase sigma factor [Armatimonadota bacterium]